MHNLCIKLARVRFYHCCSMSLNIYQVCTSVLEDFGFTGHYYDFQSYSKQSTGSIKFLIEINGLIRFHVALSHWQMVWLHCVCFCVCVVCVCVSGILSTAIHWFCYCVSLFVHAWILSLDNNTVFQVKHLMQRAPWPAVQGSTTWQLYLFSLYLWVRFSYLLPQNVVIVYSLEASTTSSQTYICSGNGRDTLIRQVIFLLLVLLHCAVWSWRLQLHF